MPFSGQLHPISETSVAAVPEQQGIFGLFEHDPITGNARCLHIQTTLNLHQQLSSILSDEFRRTTHFMIELCPMYPEGARLVDKLRREYGLPERRSEARPD